MQLNSGLPFWPVRNGLLRTYPRLEAPFDCDVLVVGAGITGALIADRLSAAGFSVGLVDGREVAWGSTSASTALLQYEIDTELQELADRFGADDAALAYRSCADAVTALGTLARSVGDVGFQRMKSVYFASRWYHAGRLKKEAAIRRQHGLPVQTLDRAALQERFGISAPVGLLTSVAAQVDPYRFAHRLLARVGRRGGRVHGRTRISAFRSVRGGVRATTQDDVPIRCRHLVFAAGYESQQYIDQRVARNRSSYAFISEPIAEWPQSLLRTLLWESARPYLYLRSTDDGRLLVGGEDDDIDIPLRRDARVDDKARKLLKRVHSLFPDLVVRSAFAWAGTFAETEDGLPFFGPHEQHGPRVHFAMAYGGNGITYSQIGADLVRAAVQGKAHPCAELFSFGRLRR